jgi:hypothetical protein
VAEQGYLAPLEQPYGPISFSYITPRTTLSYTTPRTTNGTALSLITRSFNGNTVRNFPTHGQLNPRLCSLMVRKWSTGPISLSYTTPRTWCRQFLP